MPREKIGLSFTDAVLRTAIARGLYELRLRPDWIDYAFEGMVADDALGLTSSLHGLDELAQCKKWFLATDIPVVAAQRLDSAKGPAAVTVLMLQDTEDRNKLDDRHYDTSEFLGGWPDLSSQFTPVSYSLATGILVLPPEVVTQVLVVPGQVLVDRLGRSTPVLEKLNATTIRIGRGVPLEVSGLVVRGKYPGSSVALRSAYFDESFRVGCHDRGDQSHVVWLYTLVKLSLLRVRRRLLEARGFEVTSLSGSDLARVDYFDDASQPAFARYLTVRGKVLNLWPDDEVHVTEAVSLSFSFVAADVLDREVVSPD